MRDKNEIDNNYLNYIVLLLFVGIWGSLASDPYDFLILFDNSKNLGFEINVINIINLVRAIFPTIGLIISLIIIVKYKIFFNHNNFIYILLIIQLLQFISTFASQNSFINDFESDIDHIGRYNWIISSITTIFIFMIAEKLKFFELKQLFYISIFFLILIILWFTFISIKDFFILDVKTSLYNLDVYRDSAYILGHPMPRLTGLSRSILFIYILILLINVKEKKFLIYLRYFLLIILGSLLFLYQSKFALITLILIKIFYFFSKKNKIKTGKFILFLTIFQILLFYSLSSSRNIESILVKKNLDIENINKTELLSKDRNVSHFRSFKYRDKEGIDLFQQLFFSGRIGIWEESLIFVLQRPIMGYGSMSDRIIFSTIRHDKSIAYNPTSNAFIYSLLSGGIFSLILLMYFWINIRQKIFYIFKFGENKNYYQNIGSLLIGIIFLRCMIENSMMLFGVDFIILLNSLYLTKEK